jgi:hypothetical protein
VKHEPFRRAMGAHGLMRRVATSDERDDLAEAAKRIAGDVEIAE